MKYFKSMLKLLIVTFKDVGIFFKYAFSVFCRYKHFFSNRRRPFCIFVIFHIYIGFLINITLILFDVHYFDAESSEKINC